MAIIYREGDATVASNDSGQMTFICHVVNNQGGFGAGFVNALKARYPSAERSYRKWFGKGGINFMMGNVLPHRAAENVWILHMLAQKGYSRPRAPALDYWALESCLTKINKMAY